MQLTIADNIFQSYPGVCVGIVVAGNINNDGEHAEIISQLRNEEARIRHLFTASIPSEHPNIAPWREAYRKFGAKPKEYLSSVENLVRRVAKGHSIPHINTLVDIYNATSLRFLLPVGGEDLDAVRGNIVLTRAGDNEAPVRLLGEKEERAPHPGEVVYKDDVGTICRRWNWKEAERTKLSASTRNGILVIEALPPVERNLLTTALQDLTDAIRKFCGGNLRSEIIDASRSAISLNM